MKCTYGPEAKDGDYVLTLHQYGYNGKFAKLLMGKLMDGKVYTGFRFYEWEKFVHKLSAEMVIPESALTQEQLKNIELDIQQAIEEKQKKKSKKEKKDEAVTE